MRSLHDNIEVYQTFPPAAQTADANGAAVDCADADSVAFEVSVGLWTDGVHTIGFEHSDDNSSWEDIPALSLHAAQTYAQFGDGQNLVIDANTEDNALYLIGYSGGKRYVRATKAIASETTGAVYGVTVILEMLRNSGVTGMTLPQWG